MKSRIPETENDALLESYVSAYKAIQAKSCYSPEEQDVVLLSMFFEKACLHCMDAHNAITARIFGPDSDEKDRDKSRNVIPDGKLRALSAFSHTVASRKGYLKIDIEQFLESGYSEKQLLCVIAIYGILTWNNVFSRIYEEPLKEISQNREQSIADIKTLEIVTLAS